MISSQDGILFFLCLNDRGGAEISTLKIAQGLREQGRTVTLVVYGAQPGLARELGFTGTIVDLATRRTAATLWPLMRLLRGGAFATVVAALTHTNIIAVFAACLARRGIRVVATEHGNDGIAACERSRLFHAVTRMAYARAAAVVAVSQGLAQRWRGLLPPRATVMVIYNPVVPDRLPPPPLPAHTWLSSKAVPVIIGVGRLRPEKNFALLLRAFAQLVAIRDARLVILGEGEQRAMLQAVASTLGIEGKMLMPGFVAEPAAWLAYADLFVSASQREGFGNAIAEALSYGVPVVATDCPYGPAEILAQGRYGALVPMDDTEAMRDAMLAVLAAAVDRQALCRRAGAFSVARCIDFYGKLIDNKAS